MAKGLRKNSRLIFFKTRDGAKDEDATPGEEGFRCRGLPSKMLQLFRFFGEVSTDGGRTTAFDAMGADAAWDIFIVSVRYHRAAESMHTKTETA